MIQELSKTKEALELLTVSVQFCAYLEDATSHERKEFSETVLKLLPLLYLKGTLLPDFSIMDDEEFPQDYVTEENYEIVRQNIAVLMGEKDDYLDVFVEDMKYSDTPILSTISENLADIYQDIKNFICAYKDGTEELQMTALAQCKENFKYYWGQKTVNVLRALHEACYSENETDYE